MLLGRRSTFLVGALHHGAAKNSLKSEFRVAEMKRRWFLDGLTPPISQSAFFLGLIYIVWRWPGGPAWLQPHFALFNRGHVLANNTSLETLDLAYSGPFLIQPADGEEALLWGGLTHVMLNPHEKNMCQRIAGVVVVSCWAHGAYSLWLQGCGGCGFCALCRYRQRQCCGSVRRPTLQQDPEELEFEAAVWVCLKIGTAIFMGKMMIVHGNIGRTIFRQTCLLGAFGPGTFRNFMANTHGHWVAHRNLGADTQFLTT